MQHTAAQQQADSAVVCKVMRAHPYAGVVRVTEGASGASDGRLMRHVDVAGSCEQSTEAEGPLW